LINVLGMLLTQVCVCMCVARGQVGEHFAKQEGALASKRAKRARELLGENAACMDAEGYLRMLLESPGAQPLLDFARSKGKLIVQTTTDGVEVSANTGMVITFLIVHTLHRLRNSPISAVPLSVGVYPEKPETLHLAALATGLADLTHLEWSCPRHADPRAACAACTYNNNNLEEREDNHNIETLDGGRHRIRVIDVLVNDNKTTVAMLGCSGQVCTEGAARITAELNRKVIRDGYKCPRVTMQRLQEVRKLHNDAFDAWEKESGTGDGRKVGWALSPQYQKFKEENKPFVGPPGLSADLWDQDVVKAAAVADPLHAVMDLTSWVLNHTIIPYVVDAEVESQQQFGVGFAISCFVAAARSVGAGILASHARQRYNAAVTQKSAQFTKDRHGVATSTDGVGEAPKLTARDHNSIVDRYVREEMKNMVGKGMVNEELADLGDPKPKTGAAGDKRRRLTILLLAAVKSNAVPLAQLQQGRPRLNTEAAQAEAVTRSVKGARLSKTEIKEAVGKNLKLQGKEAMSVLRGHRKMIAYISDYQRGAVSAATAGMQQCSERLTEITSEISGLTDRGLEAAEGGEAEANAAGVADALADRLTELMDEEKEVREEMVSIAADLNTAQPTDAGGPIGLPEALLKAQTLFSGLCKAVWPMVNGHEYDPDRPEEGCKSERAADPDPAKHQARVAPLCAALEAHGLDSNSSFYLHHLIAHEGDCRAALEAIYPGFAVSCQATEHANKLFKLQAITLFFMLNGWRGDTSRTMFRFIMCDRARRMIYFIETVPKERVHGALVAGEK